jgi:peptidoglycan hydrolase CwlO-like protein
MKNKKIIIAYFVISLLILLLCVFKVYAVTEEELKAKEQEIDDKVATTNTEIAGIKENMTITLEQINRLNVQIKEYEDTLDEVEEKIDGLNIELEEKNQELEEAENDYNKQKKLLDTRLVTIYESSKTTYLDLLIGAKDLSDFISKYYMLEQIAECDTDLLNSLETYKVIVQTKTNQVEDKKSEIENTKEFLEAKYGAMEILIRDKNELVESLSAEEIELNNQLEQFEQDKKEIEAELVEIAKQNAIKKSITPSQSGYIYHHLYGKTKENITTTYNGYSGHTGVDFAIPLETEVVAVKSGTVVISDALKDSNGSYKSYGEYVVIDHHDGTMTLYAHGLADSRKVEVRR